MINQINNQINIPNCYYLDNIVIISNNHYIFISLLAGIGSFFLCKYITDFFNKIRNNRDSNVLIASSVD